MRGVCIYVNTSHDPSTYEEIDSIRLQGIPVAYPQWASRVRAFSSEWSATQWGTAQTLGAPDTYGYGVDEERARETIRAIFAGPANLLDTSRNYGFGRSEERIGATIAERDAWPGLRRGFVHGFYLWGITLKVDPPITSALL